MPTPSHKTSAHEKINPFNEITLSIVSHGQGMLVKNLLNDLLPFLERNGQIILTLNIEENEDFLEPFKEKIKIIRNKKPKGFGENHNNAFKKNKNKWFAVLNPDLRMNYKILQELIDEHEFFNAGVSAPKIINSQGKLEDSARFYPTINLISKRIWSRFFNSELKPDYPLENNKSIYVDWLAGMLLLFKSKDFIEIGGFDQNYYMYLEDADICLRLRKKSKKALIVPRVQAIHDAQRASRKSFKHFKWHVKSLFLFLKRNTLQ